MNNEYIKKGSPIEYLAYQIPRQALMFLVLGLISFIAPLGLFGIQYFILAQPINTLIPLLGYITVGLLVFLTTGLLYKNVIKKGDIIVIKEKRGGEIVFDKTKYGKKILFDKRDPTTEVQVLWNGAGTAAHSGAKVLLMREGNATNENINLCVAKADWTKNLSSMVKLKSFADLAESELLENKGLLGMKWQDLAIILAIILLIANIGVSIGLVPDIVTESVMKALNSGALQHAIQSVVTTTPTVVV